MRQLINNNTIELTYVFCKSFMDILITFQTKFIVQAVNSIINCLQLHHKLYETLVYFEKNSLTMYRGYQFHILKLFENSSEFPLNI